MKRGEVWTVSAGGYAGKPRPAVIVQSDLFDETESITICLFTTDEVDAPLIRLLVEPDGRNGLRQPSYLMADKITTVRKSQLGRCIGRLAERDMQRLEQAMLVFLGIV